MVSHRTVERDGVSIHCALDGPDNGDLVVLLHGFPARWTTWREPMKALAAEGYRVVAPDLRGYGESDKPKARAAYSVLEMAADIVHVIRSLGRERARVVGHDFGGGVTWTTAMMHPDVVEEIAILNSFHPVGFEREIKRFEQLKKSWYVFFFLLPRLPEWWLSRHDYAFLRRGLADDGLAPEVIDDLLEGVRTDGALHAALETYRQSFSDGAGKRIVPRKVDCPVLVIWGDRERHFVPELAVPPIDWVSHAKVAHVPNGSHWVHHDEPEQVAKLLVEFFRRRNAEDVIR